MSLKIKRTQIHQWLVLCFILCLPLSWASFVFGSVYRMLTIIALAFFLLIFHGKVTVPGENRRLQIIWVVLTAYSVMTLIWAENVDAALLEALGMVLLCATALIFSTERFGISKDRLDYSWIAVGAVSLILFYFGERRIVGSRQTLIILGTNTDHNEFAGLFVVPIALATHKLLQTKKTWQKLLYTLFVVLGISAILLAGSRGALASMFVAVVITVLQKARLSLKYTVSVLAFVLIGGYLLERFLIPLIPEEVLRRFALDVVIDTGGSGRLFIWETGWKKITEGSVFRLLFGYGAGAEIVIDSNGNVRAMHNQLLQMLANYGLIGLAVYMTLIWKSFIHILRRNRHYIGAFCGMTTLSMTLTLAPAYKPLWVLLLMAFCGAERAEQTDCSLQNAGESEPGDCNGKNRPELQ